MLSDILGNVFGVTVELEAEHEGYDFLHLGEWIESTPQGGTGGLLLAGGGMDELMNNSAGINVYACFVAASSSDEPSQGGNIVVIANGKDYAALAEQAEYFVQFGAHSVDVFDFDVTNYKLSALAQEIVTDITQANLDDSGKEEGHEFIDKLRGAEAVFFMGGDQWPYVELLGPKGGNTNLAAKIISDGNNGGSVTLGGTSAGLAILGDYVFTAEAIRGDVDLTPDEALAAPQGTKVTLDNEVLGISALQNVITDTHFHERDRMGRLVTFLANMTLDVGTNAKGLGVDQDTALWVTYGGQASVFGTGSVYFVKPDLDLPTTVGGELTTPLEFCHLQVNRFDSTSSVFAFSSAWGGGVNSYRISASLIDPEGLTYPEVHVWRDDQSVTTKDAYDHLLDPT